MPIQFSLKHRIQFSETDMAGIVHFSNYFRLMEEVEHAWFRSLNMSVVMQHDGMHIGWPRVSAACDYMAPARFEEEVELTLCVVRLGEKSLTYEVDFMLEGRKIAVGKITSVCCRIEDQGMHAIAIPQALRERISASEGGKTTAETQSTQSEEGGI